MKDPQEIPGWLVGKQRWWRRGIKRELDIETTTVFVLVDSFVFQVNLVALNWIK